MDILESQTEFPLKVISPSDMYMTGIECSISDLSEEILVRIFSFYASSQGHYELKENVSNVCMKWNKVCKSPSLWESVGDPGLTAEQLVELSKEGFLRNTMKLNLRYIKISHKRYKQLFQIIENCDNLQILDMSQSKVTEEMTNFVAQKCKNLKSLKLDHMDTPYPYCLPGNHEVKDENRVLEPFIKVCGRNLKYLSLYNHYAGLWDNVSSTIPNECHHLEELHFSCTSDSSFMTVSEFQKGCPKLRVLVIYTCGFNCTGANKTNGFPHLQVFESNSCNELGDKELYKLLRKSKNLHTLVLNASCVSCKGLLKIPAKNIERLYVSNLSVICSNDFKKVISRWKLTLKELDVSQMNECVNIALPSLWENNSSSPLEKLHLGGSRVTAFTLYTVLHYCKHLRYLDAECCCELPMEGRNIYWTAEEVQTLRSVLLDHGRDFKSVFWPLREKFLLPERKCSTELDFWEQLK